MKNVDPEKARKRKIRRAVIIEIIFMSAGVLCCMLPLPWRLGALIAIGAREIVLKGIRAARENPPAVVHCCGWDKEQKRKPARNKAASAPKKKAQRKKSE